MCIYNIIGWILVFLVFEVGPPVAMYLCLKSSGIDVKAAKKAALHVWILFTSVYVLAFLITFLTSYKC